MDREIRESIREAELLMKLGFGDECFETVSSTIKNYEELKKQKAEKDSIRFVYEDENVDEIIEGLEEDYR